MDYVIIICLKNDRYLAKSALIPNKEGNEGTIIAKNAIPRP